MRVLVLSIVACLVAPGTALAQHRLTVDPFPEQGPVFEQERVPDQTFAVRYREVRNPSLREGNGFRLPLGSVDLVGQGESSYPADNQKIRNDSLHFAWSPSERTDFLVGAWRYKHQHESLDDVRILTVGIGARHRF